jgi:hypothetical protein
MRSAFSRGLTRPPVENILYYVNVILAGLFALCKGWFTQYKKLNRTIIRQQKKKIIGLISGFRRDGEDTYIHALFWDITQRGVLIPHRCFGTTYRFHLQGSRSPRTWISSPEASVRNYHSSLRNIPEESRSQISIHIAHLEDVKLLSQ